MSAGTDSFVCEDGTVLEVPQSAPPGATVRAVYGPSGPALVCDAPATAMFEEEAPPLPPGATHMYSAPATEPVDSSPANPAQLADNSFVRLRLIGQGGQGEVWEAIQSSLGRVCAVKLATAGKSMHADFLREAFTAAQLDHPNIAPIYDAGELEGPKGAQPIIAMKLVRGRCWRDALADERESPNFRLETFLAHHLPILIQVCNAVAFAHSRKVIHRDLKPSQVMLGDFGEVLLLDWGLSVYLGTPGGVSALMEEEGAAIDSTKVFTRDSATNPAGTPSYMAPEQTVRRTGGLGTHTDVYLLGAILYELLTGHSPHTAKTGPEALRRARINEFDPLPADVPDDLSSLVHRCMATDPGMRPDSALAVRDALESHLSGAGRRSRSRLIAEDLSAVGGWSDYDELSAASRHLSEASLLWPENPLLPELRDRVLSGFVDVAIARRHFLLAQLQAERIHDEALAANQRERAEIARLDATRHLQVPPLITPLRAFLILATWLLVSAAGWWVLATARKTVDEEVHGRVRSLATLAAGRISAEDLDAVEKSRDIFSFEFQRVLNRLNYYRLAHEDVRYIYAYRFAPDIGPEGWRVLVDVDPLDVDLNGNGTIDPDEEGNPPGAPYEDGIPAMREALESGRATSALLTDEWGSFLSGFAPVIDSATRKPVAIVGIDVTVASLREKLSRVRNAAIAAAIVIGALLTMTLLAFFQSRRTLAMVHMLEEELSRQNRELSGRHLHLG